MDKLSHLPDFKNVLAESSGQLCVVEFYAKWCGICRQMHPKILKIVDHYKNVKFLKVNIDKAKSICQAYEIDTLPAFLFFKDETEVERYIGSDTDTLARLLEEHN